MVLTEGGNGKRLEDCLEISPTLTSLSCVRTHGRGSHFVQILGKLQHPSVILWWFLISNICYTIEFTVITQQAKELLLEILYPLERILWNIFVHEFFFSWILFGRSLVSFAMSFFPAVKISLKEMPLFEKYDNWIASKALSCSHCEKEGSFQHFGMAELCAMYRSWKSKQKRCVAIIETVCALTQEKIFRNSSKKGMQREYANWRRHSVHCPVLNRPEGPAVGY